MTPSPAPATGEPPLGTAVPVRRLLLALDGFEPTGGGLSPFVEFLLRIRTGLTASDQAAVRQAAGEVLAHPGAATSGPWAIAFALLLAAPAPASALARWRRERCADPGPLRAAAGLLDAVVAELATSSRPLLQIDTGTTLADPWRRWLGERLEADPRVAPAHTRDGAGPGQALVAGWPEQPLLRRFLLAAAMCGEASPAHPLLSAIGVGPDDLDGAVDLIDQRLCGEGGEDGGVFLDDLGYQHPGFPGLLTYRFVDPALRQGILAGEAPGAVAGEARRLRIAVRSRLEVTTRAIAQLYANLGGLEGPPAGDGPRRRLRLWVGEADEASLAETLAEELRRGAAAPRALLATALRDGALATPQRLALLAAAQDRAEAAEPELALAIHVARTRLLHEAGRLDDAGRSAAEGLRWAEVHGEAGDGALLFLAARCHREQRRLEAAAQAFTDAAGVASLPDPAGRVNWHDLGVCLAEAGRCHAERGDWTAAIQLLGEAAIHLRRGDLGGTVHRDQLDLVLRNLASCTAQRLGLRR